MCGNVMWMATSVYLFYVLISQSASQVVWSVFVVVSRVLGWIGGFFSPGSAAVMRGRKYLKTRVSLCVDLKERT